MNWLQLAYKVARERTGFDLEVTGDVDEPSGVDFQVLEEWFTLAKQVSTITPILYITHTDGFEKVAGFTEKNAIVVGVHGANHVHYRELSNEEIHADLKPLSSLSKYFRYPFLGGDYRLLEIASHYFNVDSSTTNTNGSRPYKPFIRRNFWEHPIAFPSDTWFKNKHTTPKEASAMIQGSILKCRMNNALCTLLLHPNSFSIEVMKKLAT